MQIASPTAVSMKKKGNGRHRGQEELDCRCSQQEADACKL